VPRGSLQHVREFKVLQRESRKRKRPSNPARSTMPPWALHLQPECLGNTPAPVPLLRSLIAGGKEPALWAPVPASSAPLPMRRT
jgi:hypothetical protein